MRARVVWQKYGETKADEEYSDIFESGMDERSDYREVIPYKAYFLTSKTSIRKNKPPVLIAERVAAPNPESTKIEDSKPAKFQKESSSFVGGVGFGTLNFE